MLKPNFLKDMHAFASAKHQKDITSSCLVQEFKLKNKWCTQFQKEWLVSTTLTVSNTRVKDAHWHRESAVAWNHRPEKTIKIFDEYKKAKSYKSELKYACMVQWVPILIWNSKTYPHSPYIQDPHKNQEAQTKLQVSLSTSNFIKIRKKCYPSTLAIYKHLYIKLIVLKKKNAQIHCS